jgi:hypothetical protein
MKGWLSPGNVAKRGATLFQVRLALSRGLSPEQIVEEFNKAKITTPTGKRWTKGNIRHWIREVKK